MQLGEVLPLDIPAGLFDMGPKIHGTCQGLIQQLNHVQADFQGDIDPHGIEVLSVVALAHMLSLLLFVSPHRCEQLPGYGSECVVLVPQDMRDTFSCIHQDNYSAGVPRLL